MIKIYRILELKEVGPGYVRTPISDWRTSKLWCEMEIGKMRGQFEIEESNFVS